MKNILILIAMGLFSFSAHGNGPLKITQSNPSIQYKPSFGTPLCTTGIDGRRNRDCFKKGVSTISLGYGVPNFGKAFFKATEKLYPDAKVSGYGPIFVKYEYAIHDKIGLGLILRSHSAKIDYPIKGTAYDDEGTPIGDTTYTYTQKIASIAAMFRFNYHFGTGRKLDPYVGLGLGYGNTSWKFSSDDPNSVEPKFTNPIPLGLDVSIGMRYYLSSNIGLYAELRYSKSIANIGVSIKL